MTPERKLQSTLLHILGDTRAADSAYVTIRQEAERNAHRRVTGVADVAGLELIKAGVSVDQLPCVLAAAVKVSDQTGAMPIEAARTVAAFVNAFGLAGDPIAVHQLPHLITQAACLASAHATPSLMLPPPARASWWWRRQLRRQWLRNWGNR